MTQYQAPIPTEDQEHSILAAWLDRPERRGLVWFHSPNGGYRHIATASRLKRMGVKSGVPDFLILSPPPKRREDGYAFRGAAIELKRAKKSLSKVTPQQRAWLDSLDGLGWATMLSYGSGPAIAWMQALGYP